MWSGLAQVIHGLIRDDFSVFLNKKLFCMNLPLEPSQQDGSNEGSQHKIIL